MQCYVVTERPTFIGFSRFRISFIVIYFNKHNVGFVVFSFASQNVQSKFVTYTIIIFLYMIYTNQA